MKFIYISPFESQNVTNFTFWKVILLEIHDVHLIQGKRFPGTTSETYMLYLSRTGYAWKQELSKLRNDSLPRLSFKGDRFLILFYAY